MSYNSSLQSFQYEVYIVYFAYLVKEKHQFYEWIDKLKMNKFNS